jgi:hypothetical protein
VNGRDGEVRCLECEERATVHRTLEGSALDDVGVTWWAVLGNLGRALEHQDRSGHNRFVFVGGDDRVWSVQS